MSQRRGIGGHHSQAPQSVEWFTPREIIAALGPFDLDPCTSVGRPWDTAAAHYTRSENGLIKAWFGRIWLNPPYGAEIVRWMARLAEHGCGTALVFARTETAWWFQHVWPMASALLFLEGRVTFHRPDGATGRVGHNAGGPSVLIAYGLDDADRLEASGLAGAFVPLACKGQVVAVLRPTSDLTWRDLVQEIVARSGGIITLAIAYARLAEHPKAAANPNWQAKIRQTLQGPRFRRIGGRRSGTYQLELGGAAA